MASKRTFGLVSNYGGSDSEDEEENIEDEKKTNPEKFGSLVLVEKRSKPSETEDTAQEEAGPDGMRSKWEGVRTEYEDSSLMYKYTQDLEVSQDDRQPQSVSEALAAADSVLQSGQPEKAVEDSEYYKELFAQQLKREKEKKAREQAALEWEVREIQKEIADERKKWEGVWSDEEGEGAETEAIFQDQKRRNDVLQAVIDEVEKSNKKPDDGDSKLDKYTKKGEGWKRLQLIAESRVNTDPEQVNKYPSHKFPLKD